jgi:hypothetical protein
VIAHMLAVQTQIISCQMFRIGSALAARLAYWF